MDELDLHYPTFFTATILNWQTLLFNDKYKDIIIKSLRFLVSEGRIIVYAFVIMPNHIHLVWQIRKPHTKHDVQRDFLKYTAQQIKFDLTKSNTAELKKYYVGAKDREYQFWERNPLSSRLPSPELIEQKINYIHNNPISKRWHLAEDAFGYRYSSINFYYGMDNEFEFLTHYMLAYIE